MIIEKLQVFFQKTKYQPTNDIENTCILAILQILNGYHKTFQIVDYTMTNIQDFILAKIVRLRA